MHPDKCLPELVAEKNSLDPSFVHAVRLLAEEIEKYDGDELRKDGDVKKYLDIISNKNIKLSERVLIPVRQYPKEEELRKGGDAKYAHLSNDLHVLIEVFAPPGEAYSRMSHALEEIKKFLVPDYNDEIRQEQLRELSLLNGSDESSRGRSVLGRGSRPTSTTSTRGHRGTGRSAAAPRGTATPTHSKLPTTALKREAQAARARGTGGNAGYRPPLLAVTHESYDDYGYDDGYGGSMMMKVMKSMMTATTVNQREYYTYGLGTSDESYNNYEEEWTVTRVGLKAPTVRLTRGSYRKNPYGRY